MGPCSFYGDDTNNVWTYIANITAPTLSQDDRIALNATDLRRKHTVIITMEDIAANTTFELEIIRRVEGIASQDGFALE